MARSRPFRLLTLCSVALLAASGGPDSGNMVYVDSTESQGPPHGVLDLSNGTDLALSDDGSAVVDLPFDVQWYGTDASSLTVSNNGVLFFSGAQDAPITACPGGSGTWSGIAAFGDDLDAGAVHVDTLGRYPHRVFAVEWQVPHATVGGEGTVQAWLLEGGGQHQEAVIVLEDITFGSSTVDGGASAVVGVQSGDGSTGLSWSCSGGLTDGTSAWWGNQYERPASPTLLDTAMDASWHGVDNYGYIGQSLASGESNGDGLTDLLIGQPQDDQAYLLYGNLSALGGEISTTAAVVFAYDGTDTPDLADQMLMVDLDGDGLDEVLLSAPTDDLSATNAGAIYAVAGGSMASSVSIPGDADLALGGPSTLGDARAGRALVSADLDDDGYNDLVIGAPYADSTDIQAGAVYLWYGNLSSTSGLTDDLDDDPVLYGAASTDWAGYSVAAADLDGDHLPELLVGAPNADDSASEAGTVYLVAGAVSVAASRDLDTDSTLIITGSAAGDKAGTAVGFGDVDGDGLGDLFFGAPYGDDGASNAGQAYVFYDPLSSSSWTVDAADADVVVEGSTANGNLGMSVLASDLDADSVDELVVAAPNELIAVSGGGGVRIVDASTSGTLSSSDAQTVLIGSRSAGQLGGAMTAAGDVNGDGFTDLFLGAPYADYGKTGVGLAYLWSARPAFVDDDGDGFVTTVTGGIDCDDDDASVYPGATEDLTDLIDNDCDGWVDDWYSHRAVAEWMDVDVADVLGEDATADAFDFEDASTGEDLETFYSEKGLTLTPDSSGAVTAASEAWGAAASGLLAARVLGSSTNNSLTLMFTDPVDAISFQALDVDDTLELAGAKGGSLLFEGAALPAAGDDRTGGVFVGVVFASAVDEIILTAPVSDAWGLDDISVYWASRSDRDADGFAGDSGDCDDTDPDVYPGAPEDLTNGIDDDCDGTVDGGEVTVATDEGDWSLDGVLPPMTIDFEALTLGEAVDDDYADVGLNVDGSIEVDDEVDGSGPRDSQAGRSTSDVTLVFDEVQPALSLWLLDVSGDLDVEGYAQEILLYSTTVDVSNDDTDEGSFLGLTFDLGVDTLVLSSDSTDTFGIDDVTFSSLGLDDADGDGFTEADGDCDDSDADASPDEEEVWYDGVDSDCDGESDYDVDGDGHDSSEYGGGDCVDVDGSISPDEEEIWYDGVDSDCDFGSDYDADGDGFEYNPSDPESSEDCDDGDSSVSPDEEEVWYDGVDSDCDGESDYDADGDGYAASGSGGTAVLGIGDCDDSSEEIGPDADEVWYDGVDQDCDEASDYDADGDGFDSTLYGGEDCDDSREDVYPGASGEVWYDGVDQDCDGASDDDADEDGYDADWRGGEDCDDTDSSINPDAEDVSGDGIDTNCDGAAEYDDDGDGFDGIEDGGEDCDDTDDSIYPGAEDTWYDGIDSNCDGESDYDADNDAHDAEAYGGGDCDDTDATINPGATDFFYDDIDNDCDGADDFDADADGYAASWYGGTDCDDADASINPGMSEVWYDDIDSDCDYSSDYDADGDGYDIDTSGGRDCDDTDFSIRPGASEIPFDGIDQDCDGIDDVDDDGDGVLSGSDCDDTDPSISPDAEEIWYDGVDQDCDGGSDYDADGDGRNSTDHGGSDCDDSDVSISPDASEVWYDGVDSDCDGLSDYDADADGWDATAWGGGDCDDADERMNPGISTDDCDGLDNDCDGDVDEDCAGSGGTDTGDGSASDTGDTTSPDTGDTTSPDTGDTTSPDTGSSSNTDTGSTSSSDTGDATGSDTKSDDTPGGDGINADWEPPEVSEPTVGQPQGCGGCGTSGGGAGWALVLAMLVRRRRLRTVRSA